MDQYTYYPKDGASYPSTAYRPIEPAFGPHVTYHQETKTEKDASANTESVTVDGQSQPLGFRSLRWWLAEIIAALVSIASFVAIVVVVTKYRGQGLQNVHLPSQLSLNGLIALLSTICRIALMVPVESAISQEIWTWFYGTRSGSNRRQLRDLEISDEASRGAWGSFRFLLQARRNWLAYLAALLTLLTLVFGTFTQQLLNIGSFPVSDPALMPGRVPRSNHWREFISTATEGAMTANALLPPLAFKAATYNGALTASSTKLPAGCPTGNCTWPTTPSLAVCGGCVNSTWDLSCGHKDDQGYLPLCQYSLPSGEIANITDLNEVDMGVGFKVLPSTGSVYKANRTDMMFLVNFEVVGAPNGSIMWRPANNASTVAAECALWMCIQSYQTKQISAEQTQTVLKEYSIVDNSNQSASNSYDNITFVNLPSDMNIMQSSVYSVNGWSYMAMQTYLRNIFSGNITTRLSEQTPTNDIVSGIWNSSADLDTWIKSLATGLSNVVRSYGLPTEAEDAFYNGAASQLGYDIRWAWISLPAASVVLSLFIMFFTIIRTARSPVRAWKGSALTLLFIDVDPELKNEVIVAMDKREGIKNLAGKTPVMLEDRGYGNWRIRKT